LAQIVADREVDRSGVKGGVRKRLKRMKRLRRFNPSTHESFSSIGKAEVWVWNFQIVSGVCRLYARSTDSRFKETTSCFPP
jgi:hypothetical protein